MHKFIGLLDIFGFQVFQANSFEQLSINYANERLHNFFLMRVFEVEIELYRMQSLDVPTLDYPDNSKIIELLEKKPAGIFPCIDSQCKMPNASDLTFVGALQKAHKDQPHFSTLSKTRMPEVKGLRDEECFVVKHFAADVCYTGAGFLEKNADTLSPEFQIKLANSSKPFVKKLTTGIIVETPATSDGSGAARSAGGRTARKSAKSLGAPDQSGRHSSGQTTVSAKFLKGLSQLMREIATTHPYFIRCIKPNNDLKPGVFNSMMILRQLQCSGTVECVRLMQAGYPNRAPYQDLHQRFRTALPKSMAQVEPKEFVKILLTASSRPLANGCALLAPLLSVNKCMW